jgi:hypothetical protein
MIRKKPAPHLIRGVQRFSDKIMRKKVTRAWAGSARAFPLPAR